MASRRISLVDPAAYTPPYDRALAAALCARGLDVRLVTTHFPHGPVPEPTCYSVDDFFYRHGRGLSARGRRVARSAQHVPDLVRFRRLAAETDLVHYQWLPVPPLDGWLLPTGPPSVMTMHWRLPKPSSLLGRSYARVLRSMDHVIIHTASGREQLIRDFGVRPSSVTHIDHGAFDYLLSVPDERPLPGELADAQRPVVLAFGLIRPYKGTELLLEAFQRIHDAELWIVGAPRMDMREIRALASQMSDRVRLVERFVPDNEIAAIFRRADIVALPYHHIEQSGVLYSALAFGKPMIVSDVGGFPDLAELGAARLVPAGDVEALHDTIRRLLDSAEDRDSCARAASGLANGRYSWSTIAEKTERVYESVLSF